MPESDNRTFIYRIDADNRIIYVNDEWTNFARENEAPELTSNHVLGRRLAHFIDGWDTKNLYDMIYAKIRGTGRTARIPFRCDSPDRKRYFHMRISPMREETLEFTVQVLRIEPSVRRPVLSATAERSSRIVVICSWCKRIQNDAAHWTEIEEAARKLDLFGPIPPTLTHEICPDCFSLIQRQMDSRES